MEAITKFNENEELNGNKKDRNKTTVNHITSSQWRNSLGSALNRRNRGIVTTLFLPLVSSPGCPVLSVWKAVSCALKASILSSRSLGYSGNCLSLRLIRWYNLPVLGCSLEEWEIDFCKPQCGVSLSVWSWCKLEPEEAQIHSNNRTKTTHTEQFDPG